MSLHVDISLDLNTAYINVSFKWTDFLFVVLLWESIPMKFNHLNCSFFNLKLFTFDFLIFNIAFHDGLAISSDIPLQSYDIAKCLVYKDYTVNPMSSLQMCKIFQRRFMLISMGIRSTIKSKIFRHNLFWSFLSVVYNNEPWNTTSFWWCCKMSDLLGLRYQSVCLVYKYALFWIIGLILFFMSFLCYLYIFLCLFDLFLYYLHLFPMLFFKFTWIYFYVLYV